MEPRTEVLIIGGGLAGLTSAIHLTKAGKQVVLIEKNPYPQHKVCGEYISNEVLPYLQWLNADPAALSPSQISRLQVTNVKGQSCEAALPLGGFGISRFRFDDYLYRQAVAAGCSVIRDTVKEVTFETDKFQVHTSSKSYMATVVIGAFGKRDLLDHKLKRQFIQNKSPWLAVKAHYKGGHPADLVSLHNFYGGYCGVSKVENDVMNICYLVNYSSFKACKSIEEHQKQVLYKNPNLRKLFESSEMIFSSPMSIGQISFENKQQVHDHILMIGDTSGLIHPLCGNGMSMAIHAAGICSSLVVDYLEGKIASRKALEVQYERQWKAQFRFRIQAGKVLSDILLKPVAADMVMKVLVAMPGLFKPIIKMTHGRPLLMQ